MGGWEINQDKLKIQIFGLTVEVKFEIYVLYKIKQI
jgi:hypothetical protein